MLAIIRLMYFSKIKDTITIGLPLSIVNYKRLLTTQQYKHFDYLINIDNGASKHIEEKIIVGEVKEVERVSESAKRREC